MKLLVRMIDWKYPQERQVPATEVWDLDEGNTFMMMAYAFGNGVILELKADGDCEDALAVIRGAAAGTGNASPIDLSAEEKERLWLYEPGYDCYRQGKDAYFFIAPKPRPEKFSPAQ